MHALANSEIETLPQLKGSPAQDWAFAVSSIRDFAPLAMREQPYVAYAPLQFTVPSLAYINGLNFERDFAANENLHTVWPGYKQLQFSSSDWHRNAKQSGRTMLLFSHVARTFLPAAAERENAVAELADIVAQFASAVNRADLNIYCRAFGRDHECERLFPHHDGAQDFAGGIYLKGRRTVQVAPDNTAPLQPIDPRHVPIEYSSDPRLVERLRCVPEQTISLWPTTQKHSDPTTQDNTQDNTRVAIFLFANRRQNRPAL